MAIADAEIERRRLGLLEQLAEPRLTAAGEYRDRPEIGAERLEVPDVRPERRQRNSGVVLHDLLRMRQHEVAHLGEVAAVHQVGRALEQAVAVAERRGEFQEAAGCRRRRSRRRCGNSRASAPGRCRVASTIFTPGTHAARLAHGRMKIAVPVEVDEADLADRLAGARDIDVEDRKRAGEIAAAQAGCACAA